MTTRVSVTLPQFHHEAGPLLDAARRAEALGFDGVFVFDHLFPLGGRHRPILEGFTALGAVAAVTTRVTIGTLVVRAPIRPPQTTARAAWTAQIVSGGRLTLGLGAADSLSKPEFEAFGLPFGDAADRIRMVRETVDAICAMQHLAPGFRRPPVWIGGRSARVQELAAQVADGWNAWGGSPDRLAGESGQVRRLAQRPFTVSWGGQVIVAPDKGALHRRLAGYAGREEVVAGTPPIVAERLRAYVEAGADELVLSLIASDDWDAWSLFHDEVKPAL